MVDDQPESKRTKPMRGKMIQAILKEKVMKRQCDNAEEEGGDGADINNNAEVKRQKKMVWTRQRRETSKNNMAHMMNENTGRTGALLARKKEIGRFLYGYRYQHDLELAGEDELTRRYTALHPIDRMGRNGNYYEARLASLLTCRNEVLQKTDGGERTCRACMTAQFQTNPQLAGMPGFTNEGLPEILVADCCSRPMCSSCIYEFAAVVHKKSVQLGHIKIFMQCPCCGDVDRTPTFQKHISDNPRPSRWLVLYWLGRILYTTKGSFTQLISQWLEDSGHGEEWTVVAKRKANFGSENDSDNV